MLHSTSDKNNYGKTSSSAVAKRPRDASCLSLVSFNSTKHRAESVIISYVGYRFITTCKKCFGVTLRLLVINISLTLAINKRRRLLPTISVTTCGTAVLRRRVDNTWPVAALTARSEASSQSRFLPTPPAFDASVRKRGGGSRRNIAMPFGTEKLEWHGYPTVKKI